MKRKTIIGPGTGSGGSADPTPAPGSDEIVRRYGTSLAELKRRLLAATGEDAEAGLVSKLILESPPPPENPDDDYIRTRYGAALDRIRRHLVSPDETAGDPDSHYAVVRIDARRRSIEPILVDGYRVNPDVYQPDWAEPAVACRESAAFMGPGEPPAKAGKPESPPPDGTLVLQSKNEKLTGQLALQYQPAGVKMAVRLQDRNAVGIDDFKLSVFDGAGRKVARRSTRQGELKFPELPPDSYRLEARAPDGATCVMSLKIEKRRKRS
jgi:hypothetical protein